MNNTNNKDDWRNEVEQNNYQKVESFKLKSGSASVTFKTEGMMWYDQANGKEYVIFKVQKEGDIVRPFFVNKENHPFLRQLKSFGQLTNKQIVLTRTGERRATRWSAILPEEQVTVKTGVVE